MSECDVLRLGATTCTVLDACLRKAKPPRSPHELQSLNHQILSRPEGYDRAGLSRIRDAQGRGEEGLRSIPAETKQHASSSSFMLLDLYHRVSSGISSLTILVLFSNIPHHHGFYRSE